MSLNAPADGGKSNIELLRRTKSQEWKTTNNAEVSPLSAWTLKNAIHPRLQVKVPSQESTIVRKDRRKLKFLTDVTAMRET